VSKSSISAASQSGTRMTLRFIQDFSFVAFFTVSAPRWQ
jgi:hypothetical protein